jgi:hypothetical protein
MTDRPHILVQSVVDEALVMSDAGLSDRANAELHGVAITTIRRWLRDGPKRYEYPGYLFSNESTDILAICTDALDAIGARRTAPRRNVVSVARRESVAKLDQFVGPKS